MPGAAWTIDALVWPDGVLWVQEKAHIGSYCCSRILLFCFSLTLKGPIRHLFELIHRRLRLSAPVQSLHNCLTFLQSYSADGMSIAMTRERLTPYLCLIWIHFKGQSRNYVHGQPPRG